MIKTRTALLQLSLLIWSIDCVLEQFLLWICCFMSFVSKFRDVECIIIFMQCLHCTCDFSLFKFVNSRYFVQNNVFWSLCLLLHTEWTWWSFFWVVSFAHWMIFHHLTNISRVETSYRAYLLLIYLILVSLFNLYLIYFCYICWQWICDNVRWIRSRARRIFVIDIAWFDKTWFNVLRHVDI